MNNQHICVFVSAAGRQNHCSAAIKLIMDTRESKRTICAVFWLLLVMRTTTTGTLLKFPKDQSVTVGQSVTFECQTDLSLPVFWYFNNHEIFYGGKVSMSFHNMFKVSTDGTGVYDLVISSADKTYNGEYICGDDEGQGEKRQARLNVTDPATVVTTEQSASTSSENNMTAVYIGIAIGVVCIAGAIGLIICLCCRGAGNCTKEKNMWSASTTKGPTNAQDQAQLERNLKEPNKEPSKYGHNKNESVTLLCDDRQTGPTNAKDQAQLERNLKEPNKEPSKYGHNKNESVALLCDDRQTGPNNAQVQAQPDRNLKVSEWNERFPQNEPNKVTGPNNAQVQAPPDRNLKVSEWNERFPQNEPNKVTGKQKKEQTAPTKPIPASMLSNETREQPAGVIFPAQQTIEDKDQKEPNIQSPKASALTVEGTAVGSTEAGSPADATEQNAPNTTSFNIETDLNEADPSTGGIAQNTPSTAGDHRMSSNKAELPSGSTNEIVRHPTPSTMSTPTQETGVAASSTNREVKDIQQQPEKPQLKPKPSLN